MNNKIAISLPLRKSATTILLGILTISGISFWFWLGFPFANHNESYGWIPVLNHWSLYDALTREMPFVATPRPLGVATAWLTYTLSGGSIYPQQILNYLEGLVAWLILFLVIKEKQLFAWISFLAGGAFFSGYIYLFHIHGVFYSPLLVFLAYLLSSLPTHKGFQVAWLLVISGMAALTALYHPFAVAICVAALFGYLLENRHLLSRRLLAVTLSVIFGLIVALILLVPKQAFSLPANAILGLLTSYKDLELNRASAAVSWLLALVAVVGSATTRRSLLISGIGVTIVSLGFVLLNWPLLILWVGASFVRATLLGKWTTAFLILSTALLPAVTATGSPTYCVPVVMVCSYATAVGNSLVEKTSLVSSAAALVTVVLIGSAAILLRSGIHLPVLSTLTNPLLAEREKTFQLENIIEWMMASDFKEYQLELCQAAGSPSSSTNAIDRIHRPPTQQKYLDRYIDSLRVYQPSTNAGVLEVCFGGQQVDNAQRVYSVAGRYSGEAIVWKLTQ